MQNQTPSFNSFAKTIEDYLLSIKVPCETVRRATNNEYLKTGRFFYSESGLEALKIQEKSFIGVFYVNNPHSFNHINLSDYFQGDNIYVFVNVEKRFSLKSKNNWKIIYLDDLNYALHIEDSNNYFQNDNPKGKCIPILKFDEFLRFSIRARILSKLFDIVSYKIYDIKNETGLSVFPFLYDHGFEKFVFFVDKRELLKTSFSKTKKEHIRYAQVSVKGNEINSDSLQLTITFKEMVDFDRTNYGKNSKHITIQKLNTSDLNEFAILFNRNSRYYIDEFIPLYKYRQFAKIRYSPSEEKVTYSSKPVKYADSYEIYIGSRSAIENDLIWFSNYDSLNDPFDLIIRFPSVLKKKTSSTLEDFYQGIHYYDIKKSGILVFCTTKSDNSILMWSHYGDAHKGMCTGYLENDILSTIACDASVGICFYGKVEYLSERPVFKIALKELAFVTTDLAYFRFNVQNLFSKYSDWDYEEEYRFILVPTADSFSEYIKCGGHSMTLKPFDYIFGYNFPPCFDKYFSSVPLKLNKFKLSDSEYELIKL